MTSSQKFWHLIFAILTHKIGKIGSFGRSIKVNKKLSEVLYDALGITSDKKIKLAEKNFDHFLLSKGTQKTINRLYFCRVKKRQNTLSHAQRKKIKQQRKQPG